MSATRPAVAAGRFYPSRPEELRSRLTALLARAAPPGPDEDPPKALVAPHAGIAYSGAVAAAAYRRLQPLRGTVSRAVLLGPAHFVPLPGLALPTSAAFATPLADVRVDREFGDRVARLPGVSFSDAAHAPEHSLEVQLPFLIASLGDVAIVPLAVGDALDEDLDDALAVLWGGRETVVVVSTDLSHFHDRDTARRLDTATAAAVERLDDGAIDGRHACGHQPLRGLLRTARRRDLRPRNVALADSSEAGGDPEAVVGYGAWTFAPASRPTEPPRRP